MVKAYEYSCGVKWCNRCKVHKPFEMFSRYKGHYTGRTAYCKECTNTYSKGYHAKNKAKRQYQEKRRAYYLLSNYGITIQQYEDMLRKQDGKCSICRVEIPPRGSLTHLDHCHNSGKLRGILCTNCNRGLGHFQDNTEFLRVAAYYLETYQQ